MRVINGKIPAANHGFVDGSDQGIYTRIVQSMIQGYNRVTIGLDEAGRHIFFFTINNRAGNIVLVDVI
ncbi:MAG TPA: hypothetical protein VN455_08805 [Methanotrichaceae archaeon]|nr:hypothetical protein [Methanotrichaceae archaeon]